jgi:hypothetical protein
MIIKDAENDYMLHDIKVKVYLIRYSTSRSPLMATFHIIFITKMRTSLCFYGSEVRTLDTEITVVIMLFQLKHVFLDIKQGKQQNMPRMFRFRICVSSGLLIEYRSVFRDRLQGQRIDINSVMITNILRRKKDELSEQMLLRNDELRDLCRT